MNELLQRLSNYNLFNYLLPGAVFTEIGGELPVNPSGGVLATNPVGATAMIRVGEAALQVMGEAGEHQIPDVKTALATGYGGNAWTEVLILETVQR